LQSYPSFIRSSAPSAVTGGGTTTGSPRFQFAGVATLCLFYKLGDREEKRLFFTKNPIKWNLTFLISMLLGFLFAPEPIQELVLFHAMQCLSVRYKVLHAFFVESIDQVVFLFHFQISYNTSSFFLKNELEIQPLL
jgi:hypothetical protein